MRRSTLKIRIALALVGLLASGGALPAEPPAPLTVAVYDFNGTGVKVDHIGAKATALITAELTTETNLTMLERADLTKELSEQAFGVAGMVSSDAAAKIGQLTGAKVLVSGQVIKTADNHVTIVANIIGTETGRLFAAKTEGAPDNLADLSAEMGRKIAQTISAEATNLVAVAGESRDAHLERILKSIQGTNRPAVSLNILFPSDKNKQHSVTTEGEFGAILLKAGFTVVDAASERKADVEITGVANVSAAPARADLFTARTVIDLKVQHRQSGEIIMFDRQEATATDVSRLGAENASQVSAVDDLAGRVLPILAK